MPYPKETKVSEDAIWKDSPSMGRGKDKYQIRLVGRVGDGGWEKGNGFGMIVM